jgi:hypothetical protein
MAGMLSLYMRFFLCLPQRLRLFFHRFLLLLRAFLGSLSFGTLRYLGRGWDRDRKDQNAQQEVHSNFSHAGSKELSLPGFYNESARKNIRF